MTSKVTAAVIFLSSLLLQACGDDSSSSFPVENSSSPKNVETIYDLGKCTDKRKGEVIFVTEDDREYVCFSGKWISTDEEDISSSSAKQSSSTEKTSSSSKNKELSSSSSAKDEVSSNSKQSSSSNISSSSAKQSSSTEKTSSSSKNKELSSSSSAKDEVSSNSKQSSSSEEVVSSCSKNESSSSFKQSSSSKEIPSSSSKEESSSSVAKLVAKIMPSGAYNCDVYRCVPTIELNLTMLADGEYGEFMDPRDSIVYKTIKIGTQVWMAQDFAFRYSHETAQSTCYISTGYKPTDTCLQNRLYKWSAAMDSAGVFSDDGLGCGDGVPCNKSGNIQGVCPDGWHIPSREEWNVLVDNSGKDDITRWDNLTLGNSTGFSVRSGVVWYPNDKGDKFNSNKKCFWSSTERIDNGSMFPVYFTYIFDVLYKSVVVTWDHRSMGCSVRCLLNE